MEGNSAAAAVRAFRDLVSEAAHALCDGVCARGGEPAGRPPGEGIRVNQGLSYALRALTYLGARADQARLVIVRRRDALEAAATAVERQGAPSGVLTCAMAFLEMVVACEP